MCLLFTLSVVILVIALSQSNFFFYGIHHAIWFDWWLWWKWILEKLLEEKVIGYIWQLLILLLSKNWIPGFLIYKHKITTLLLDKFISWGIYLFSSRIQKSSLMIWTYPIVNYTSFFAFFFFSFEGKRKKKEAPQQSERKNCGQSETLLRRSVPC